MLRLIHAQTVTGAILVDDIDDRLPNKTVDNRAGDPKAFKTDGQYYKTKQKCYIPRVKATDATVAGYIDLSESPNVMRSAAAGKIAGLYQAGKILAPVSFVAADLATPVVASATLDSPGAGDLTIAGTGFLSVDPEISSVILTGTGAVTLTKTQITTGGGTFTDTSIVILAASVPGIATTTTSAKVRADAQNSNTVAVA